MFGGYIRTQHQHKEDPIMGGNLIDLAREKNKRWAEEAKKTPAPFNPHQCFSPIILDIRNLNAYFVADVVKREGEEDEVQISICTLGPHPRQVATVRMNNEQWGRFKAAGDLRSEPRPNSYDVEED